MPIKATPSSIARSLYGPKVRERSGLEGRSNQISTEPLHSTRGKFSPSICHMFRSCLGNEFTVSLSQRLGVEPKRPKRTDGLEPCGTEYERQAHWRSGSTLSSLCLL